MDFRGLYTAILTPFENGGDTIDYDSYARLVEQQIKGGVHGIVPCGTTGESPTLSHDEHRELIKKTVEFVRGRVKVIAGTGSNSTREAREFTAAACKDGVDAVMLVNPYYNKPTQDGLFQHFSNIAAVADKPVILYNIKGRTAVNIEPETLARLAEIDNIKAVKEASGDPGQMARIIHQCGKRMALLSGDDNITPAVMGLGGNGVISVASNIYPYRISCMVDCFLRGDFKAGNTIFYNLLEFMNAMFWQTNPIPVKAAAVVRGICQPDIRLPMTLLPEELKVRLVEVMDRTGDDSL